MGSPITAFPINTKTKADLGTPRAPATGECLVGMTGGATPLFFAVDPASIWEISAVDTLQAITYVTAGDPDTPLAGFLIRRTDHTTYIADAADPATEIVGATIVADGLQIENVTFTAGVGTLTLGGPIGRVSLMDGTGRAVLTNGGGLTLSGTGNKTVTVDGAGTGTQAIPDGAYPILYRVIATLPGISILREPATFAADGNIDTDEVDIAAITAGTTYTLTGARRSITIDNKSASPVTINPDAIIVSVGATNQLANYGSGWEKV